jgi:hypothetical protein
MWLGIASVLLIDGEALAEPTAPYTFVSLDVPGATSTQAIGINDGGDVVGGFTSGGGQQTGGGFTIPPSSLGFLLRNGNFTTIDFPGGPASTSRALNNLGDVVGVYVASDERTLGYLLSGGTLLALMCSHHYRCSRSPTALTIVAKSLGRPADP